MLSSELDLGDSSGAVKGIDNLDNYQCSVKVFRPTFTATQTAVQIF